MYASSYIDLSWIIFFPLFCISKLVENIHRRGREFENSISIDYLSRLNERYEAWVQNYDKGKIISIDVDKINFVDEPKDFGNVINIIDKEINGLF